MIFISFIGMFCTILVLFVFTVIAMLLEKAYSSRFNRHTQIEKKINGTRTWIDRLYKLGDE